MAEVLPVRLGTETLQAFLRYTAAADAAINATVWPVDSKRARQAQRGKIIAEPWSGNGPLAVRAGLIHDWIGAVFIPGSAISSVLARIQDYDNHKIYYEPDVIDSKLIARHANDFKIYLRVLKKKILTVVLETEHDVHYCQIDARRWRCRSRTTRCAEVHDAGKTTETVQPPDSGYGFLWRLDSFWSFEERDAGVYAECRAISLTRDIPAGLGWIVAPIVRNLPKETLVHTLKATREAVIGAEK
jgi:hypothetical protein